MTPEFSRPVRIDTLGEARPIAVSAEPEERAALARRFGLIAIDALEGTAEVRREGESVTAEGRLHAVVTQACAATGDPIPTTIDEGFTLRFVPEGSAETVEEIELDAADCDTIDYSGGAIDLGEAIAETMALALDPFPRRPDADAILKAAGVLAEDEAGPFSALKALRDKLSG